MFCAIRPPIVESFRPSIGSVPLPIGLAYIAAAVEDSGRTVHVIDALFEGVEHKTRYIKGYLVGLPLEEIVTRIPENATSIGISVIFTHEWPAVVRLASLIKAARPDLALILGGEHVTSMPEFCLATSSADMLVLGEGEETIVRLLDSLERDEPLDAVDGIAYRDGVKIKINPRRVRRTDVDDIRRPAWHLFDIQGYSERGLVGGLQVSAITIPMLGTRGCPYQCSFCSAPNMWTPRWIPRDPVKVVDEIEDNMKIYGATNFPFQDLTAVLKREWVIEFCNEIIHREMKITWQMPSGTRCEQIDTEVAELLRQSGMISMGYAPESGSESLRKLIKKKMKTESLMASIEAAIKSDLNVGIFIVLGFPQETEATLEETLALLKRLRKAGAADVSVGFYMALPGTEMFNSLYDLGQVRIDQDYFGHIMQGSSFWPSVSYNNNLSRLQMVKWKLKLFHAFYGTANSWRSVDGLTGSIREAIVGLFSRRQESRLQTAFRHFLRTGWDSIIVRFTKPWIPKRDEVAIFAGWDEIYRDIRKQMTERNSAERADANVSPAGGIGVVTQGNVIKSLRALHDQSRVISRPRA